MSTVKSTEGRIFNFSLAESALMVCMAGLQVFVVRFFFQGARKGEWCDDLFRGGEANVWGRLCMSALRVAIRLQRLSMSWCYAPEHAGLSELQYNFSSALSGLSLC